MIATQKRKEVEQASSRALVEHRKKEATVKEAIEKEHTVKERTKTECIDMKEVKESGFQHTEE